MGAGGVDNPPVDALGVVDGLPGDVRCPESVTSCISKPGHMSQLRICFVGCRQHIIHTQLLRGHSYADDVTGQHSTS